MTITVDDAHRVSGLLLTPSHARACYLLAHGAGAGMSHPFMDAVAAGLAERGIATLRYQFPYMEQRAKRPDPPKLAHATVRAAAAEAARLVPALPLVAGGKSFGGRMTSQAQAASPLPGVRGLAFLGFPLHPAGRPSDERGEHLFDGAGPDAASARNPRSAGGHRAASAVERTTGRARIVAAVPGCRSFLPRAGPQWAKGCRRQTRNDGCARRLDPVGGRPAGLARRRKRLRASRAPEERKRSAALARAFEASTSRSRGGALVTSEPSSSWAACATWSTARLNASSLAFEGRVHPLNLRTNWRDEARISSSVAGGSKLCSVLMFRHMGILIQRSRIRGPRSMDRGHGTCRTVAHAGRANQAIHM